MSYGRPQSQGLKPCRPHSYNTDDDCLGRLCLRKSRHPPGLSSKSRAPWRRHGEPSQGPSWACPGRFALETAAGALAPLLRNRVSGRSNGSRSYQATCGRLPVGGRLGCAKNTEKVDEATDAAQDTTSTQAPSRLQRDGAGHRVQARQYVRSAGHLHERAGNRCPGRYTGVQWHRASGSGAMSVPPSCFPEEL